MCDMAPTRRQLLSRGCQTGIVLCRSRIFDIFLEMGEALRRLEASFAKQLKMLVNFKATRLVSPRSAHRLDEVAINKQPPARQNFVAAGINLGDSLLAAEIM